MSMKHQQCRNTSHTSSHYVREVSVVRKKWQKHLYLCELFRDTMKKNYCRSPMSVSKTSNSTLIKKLLLLPLSLLGRIVSIFTLFILFRLRCGVLLFPVLQLLLLYEEEKSNNFYFNFIFICLEANERLLKTFRKKIKYFQHVGGAATISNWIT